MSPAARLKLSPSPVPELSPRSFGRLSSASSWEEIWEAGAFYRRASELLAQSKDYAIFAGWQIDSRLPFPNATESLKNAWIRTCEEKPGFHLYVIMWAHAYIYCVEREPWQARIWDGIHPRIHFIFDNRHPRFASHHEKITIFDGKIALCGGIDYCNERWDSPQHLYNDPRRSLDWKKERHGPYHDISVQVSGPICGELQKHLLDRWKGLSSVPFPEPLLSRPQPDGHPVYFSRTIVNLDSRPEEGAGIVREIEFLFRDLIQNAKRRIIIEGQYYWSRDVNDLLISKMRQMKGKDFELILVVSDLRHVKSLTRKMAAYQLQLLEKLHLAARLTGTRLIAGSPVVEPPEGVSGGLKPVYIHSKVILVDDDFLSIGTANLADRALRIDTEVNLTFAARTSAERAHIQRVAREMIRHWNVEGRSGKRGVRLRPFEFKSAERSFPWQKFFDPRLPPLFLFKRRIRQLSRRSLRILALLGGALTLVLAQAAIGSSVVPESRAWWVIYSFTLASVWLERIPFLSIALICSVHLGGTAASALVIASYLVASLLGYSLMRLFPHSVDLVVRPSEKSFLSARRGIRNFEDLVRVMIDPRLSLRSKIIYQGLSFTPWAWYLLMNCLVFPSFFYVLCRWAVPFFWYTIWKSAA